MHRLRTVLNDRGFTVTERKRTEDYVHARVPAPASGEVFAFKDGAVVCWDMAEGEVQRLRSYLRLVEADRYDEELVDSEEMAVTYGRGR